MQFIPTNDVFHHLLLLLRLHKDKELIIDMFKAQGIDVTKAKIKAWATTTGGQKPAYRDMPRSALDAFIDECYKRQLISE